MINKIILSAIIIILIASCASSGEIKKEKEIAINESDTSVTFRGLPKTEGVKTSDFSKHYDDSNIRTYFFLSSIGKKSSSVSHQIYIGIDYHNGWRFYNTASLVDGTTLQLMKISSDVKCSRYICNYNEQMAVTFSDKFIRNNSDGFKVKLKSKSGYETSIHISSKQISKQVKNIEDSPYFANHTVTK